VPEGFKEVYMDESPFDDDDEDTVTLRR